MFLLGFLLDPSEGVYENLQIQLLTFSQFIIEMEL